MKVIVEIGDDNTKKDIEEELNLFCSRFDKDFFKKTRLSLLIVPVDFDNTVNSLQNTTDYISCRSEQQAVAKVIERDSGNLIVLSSSLYSNSMQGLRFYFFCHELCHLRNRFFFKVSDYVGTAKSRYLNFLTVLFDEYVAYRYAFNMVEETDKNFFDKDFESHTESLKIFYSEITKQISQYKEEGDIKSFLKSIASMLDGATKAIVIILAYLDSFLGGDTKTIAHLPFINERAIRMHNFFKEHFSSEKIDFESHLESIGLFLLNFGVKFEDTADGEYCHVIDI